MYFNYIKIFKFVLPVLTDIVINMSYLEIVIIE